MQGIQEMWLQSLGWEDPWRRKWQPTPVFLLENCMDREAWRATVLAGTKTRTILSDWVHTHTHTHTPLNKKNRRKVAVCLSMATRTVMTCFLFIFLCSSVASPFSVFNLLLNQLYSGHNMCLFTVEKKRKSFTSLVIYILSQTHQANSMSSLKQSSYDTPKLFQKYSTQR